LRAEPLAMPLRIVAPVALQHVRATSRPTPASPNGGQRPDESVELRNVIDVRGRHLPD
jgi:hypothetical protein